MGSRRRLRPDECDHTSPVVTERTDGEEYVARCLMCGTVGPVRESPEEALKALQQMGKQRRD
jgi:uncharacterized Zn finger protein